MTPKIIHYCWFGKNPKPPLVEKCIESWRLFCPDFTIKEWNESNTLHIKTPFFKNALRKKKYAFAADFVRAIALFEEGGIYLDTDMLLLKPIDFLLQHSFFIGEEVNGRLAFGIFGAVAGHQMTEYMLNYYKKTYFDVFSPPVITHTFTPFLLKNKTKEIVIFPPEVFYAMPYEQSHQDFKDFITSKSIAVHLWNHSWKTTKNDSTWQYFINLLEVTIDFLFYNYPKSYFIRYAKEFLRKIYHKHL